MLNNLNSNDAAKLQQVLSDKEAANKLLNSPQAQVLLKNFGQIRNGVIVYG